MTERPQSVWRTHKLLDIQSLSSVISGISDRMFPSNSPNQSPQFTDVQFRPQILAWRKYEPNISWNKDGKNELKAKSSWMLPENKK